MGNLAAYIHASAMSQTIQAVRWIVPLVQCIHILMVGIVFVSSLVIALRVLGRIRVDESFAAVWGRFAPWLWAALAVLLVTGVVLVIGEPAREFAAISFWLKMALVVICVVTTGRLGVSMGARQPASGVPTAGHSSRLAAWSLIVMWIAIIFLGRAIAYDVEVWGAFSLHG